MTDKPKNATSLLDEIAWGLSLNGICLMPCYPTVTIELDRKSAEAFAWNISQELEVTMKDYMRPAPIITLGSVFQYRGVNFRIVEKVK